jgi:hypothetical protein
MRRALAYETLLYDVDDAVATITLSRPERVNTIVPPLPEEFRPRSTTRGWTGGEGHRRARRWPRFRRRLRLRGGLPRLGRLDDHDGV